MATAAVMDMLPQHILTRQHTPTLRCISLLMYSRHTVTVTAAESASGLDLVTMVVTMGTTAATEATMAGMVVTMAEITVDTTVDTTVDMVDIQVVMADTTADTVDITETMKDHRSSRLVRLGRFNLPSFFMATQGRGIG